MLCALLACVACRDDVAKIALGPLLPERDAGPLGPTLPEGAVACSDDSMCDDGIDCTRDTCAEGRYCIHASDASLCSDGIFCNGEELCDATRGCLPASRPRNCDDDEVCTVDHCDEQLKSCVHAPRDFDGDGESDWHCAGGTDCDDFDSTRSPSLPEICDDGIDNDCDDMVDETADCGTPAHDRCDDALDVSAGGSFSVSLAGAKADYALKCGTNDGRDAAFAFTLKTAQDVTLTAHGLLSDASEETAVVAVRRDCGDVATELDCSRGFPGEVRMRALPPGRYFAIVSSVVAAKAWLEARFDPPTVPAANVSCDAATPIDGNAHLSGSFVDVGDHTQLACGYMGSEDLFYRFTIDRPRDVVLLATSVTGERMNFAVRSACDDAATSLRCVSDSPAFARLYQLPAGTYFVVLESSPVREVDFNFDVTFLEPSQAPPGHGCGSPIDLPLDMQVTGSLANHQDLVDVECGCPSGDCNLFRPDIVYRVTLDAPGDLGLTIDGGDYTFSYDLRSVCDDRATQLSCSPAPVQSGRIRNLAAGSYYLVLESAGAGTFQLEAKALPRSIPTAAKGNDTCGTATEIPEGGGLFSGDTLNLLNDYEARCGGGAASKDAAFHLQLTQRAQVTANVQATFDSVLYRYEDNGDGMAPCRSGTESNCNDDRPGGGTDSALSEEVLGPGSYYYIVDGFNNENGGQYLFEVNVVDLGP